MQLLNTETKIDFIGLRKTALIFSLLLLASCIYSLFTQGLNLGIQYFGTSKDILVRIPLSEQNSSAQVSSDIIALLNQKELNKKQVNDKTQTQKIEVRSVEFVGPQFGKELMEKGVLALLYALIVVMIYVAFRFEWKFSFGSVCALVHDVLITVGIFSLLSMEFTLPVLAALLAVIGYSLNDTIVVFDRIRENFRKLRDTDTETTMNFSINQTLPRTVLTSLTTLLVLSALYVFGGEALQGFAATLIIGVLIGTYSSIFVASPVVLALGAKAEDLIVEEVEKEGADQPDMYLP